MNSGSPPGKECSSIPSSGSGLSAGRSRSGLSAGAKVPAYHKRAFAHNYHAPFIYHIILKKADVCGKFGTVKGDARIAPGNQGCAYIEESELGSILFLFRTPDKEAVKISRKFTPLSRYVCVQMNSLAKEIASL